MQQQGVAPQAIQMADARTSNGNSRNSGRGRDYYQLEDDDYAKKVTFRHQFFALVSEIAGSHLPLHLTSSSTVFQGFSASVQVLQDQHLPAACTNYFHMLHRTHTGHYKCSYNWESSYAWIRQSSTPHW